MANTTHINQYKNFISYLNQIAEQVIDNHIIIFEAKYPEDLRPRKAMEIAKKYWKKS